MIEFIPLFPGMVWKHPLIRRLVEGSVSAQQQSLGDGGLLAVILASRLVYACLQSDPHFTYRRHLWTNAWQEAAEWYIPPLKTASQCALSPVLYQ
eukprot:scaffold62463_cov40-Prasinocladus_malaysianus.AAC.1